MRFTTVNRSDRQWRKAAWRDRGFNALRASAAWHAGCIVSMRIGDVEANPKEDETMRKLTTKLTIAATVLLAAAGAASAQKMTARIPFEFRVGNRVMPAGTYHVGLASSAPIFLLRSDYARRSAILVAQLREDPKKAWAAEGRGKLEFACAGKVCALADSGTGRVARPTSSVSPIWAKTIFTWR